MERSQRAMKSVTHFMIGGGFPAFFLALLFFYELFLLVMLLAPASSSGLGAFAEDFRVWCLGYDPATGRTQWAYVISMATPQIFLGLIVAMMWWQPLCEHLARPRALVPQAAAAAIVIAALVGGLVLVADPPPTGELAFPADALRTHHIAPRISLTNQENQPIELAAMEGKVVMLTAMFASCGHTCPLILEQSKRAVESLSPEQRSELRVVAVTLDPGNDTTEVLSRLAGMHEMETPLFNLLTGEPDEVERVLDRMGVERERDPETGVIDHANLFLLIDRSGKVAYRFSLGERQERWLGAALQILLRERTEAG
ncbi:MAG: SCO family protein [Deltaproteobacteria bacterium]|nr:SCO family protein [Deltaproteobacteria bacterium]